MSGFYFCLYVLRPIVQIIILKLMETQKCKIEAKNEGGLC